MNDNDELRRLWQSQKPEKNMNQTISLSEIRVQASAFDRKMRFRNAREYVAAAIICAGFGWRAFHAHSWLESAASVEIVLTAIWITATLVRSVTPEPGPSATMREVLAFHRTQMDRQIKLLSRAYVWYVAPLAVGLTGLMTSDFLRLGATPPLIATSLIFVVVFGFVAFINRRAAAKIENDRSLLPRIDA
jgi:hypothetical protein